MLRRSFLVSVLCCGVAFAAQPCLTRAQTEPVSPSPPEPASEPEVPVQTPSEPAPPPEPPPPPPEPAQVPPPPILPAPAPAPSAPAPASDTSPSVAEAITHRELGGHYFPVALFVPPALTLSYFGIRAGIEYHSVPGFTRDLSFFSSGEERPAHLETVNATETVDFALRLHDLLAIVGSGYGAARVGANVDTLLGSGADYTYGGSGGVLFKIFRVAGFQLAARAEIGYFAGQQAGIVELFQDIGAIVDFNIRELAMVRDVNELDLPGRLARIENSIRVATSAMLTPFHGLDYGGSLNVAQSLGAACGLQGAAGLYGKSATYDIPRFDATTSTLVSEAHEVDKFYPRLGVAFDADLAHVGVPIDLMLEYMLTRTHSESDLPDASGEYAWTEHLFALGVHYSGLPDLQLGIMAYLLRGQSNVSAASEATWGKPLDVGSQFVFRYLR